MIKKQWARLMRRITLKMLKDGIPPELEADYEHYFKLEERFDKMEKIKMISSSKRLSYLLRHNPEDLDMDKNGWVQVDDVLKKLDIDFDILSEIVETNDKKRFSFDDSLSMIRANQGHSIDVDVQLKETTPPEKLYHGTSPSFVDAIMRSGGLSKMKRQHVHLSVDKDTAYKVGKRHSKYAEPAIFVVESGKMKRDGFKFYLSENGVWLTEYVPKKYITI